jgi:hypothetical protein
MVVDIHDAGEKNQSAEIIHSSFQKPDIKLKAVPIQNVRLLNSIFRQMCELNRKYLMSLENDKSPWNLYFEAGITKAGRIMLNKDKNHDEFYSCGLKAEQHGDDKPQPEITHLAKIIEFIGYAYCTRDYSSFPQ